MAEVNVEDTLGTALLTSKLKEGGRDPLGKKQGLP